MLRPGSPRPVSSAVIASQLRKADDMISPCSVPSKGRMTERTIPILPCKSIEETLAFYRALGFDGHDRCPPSHQMDAALEIKSG
jgi:hypothetical protein